MAERNKIKMLFGVSLMIYGAISGYISKQGKYTRTSKNRWFLSFLKLGNNLSQH